MIEAVAEETSPHLLSKVGPDANAALDKLLGIVRFAQRFDAPDVCVVADSVPVPSRKTATRLGLLIVPCLFNLLRHATVEPRDGR
ncbi:hypothetical protein MES5069_800019 [Mesorhizobium escarrei]|uniref:Uncharacterized protein n=1 Tax=Mesorhizobium escarrei TaxID=666018 RepID=A0ABM9EIX2_9HYPH|nr:hypothetical protein MES5069_800019 [Mesorhizobium escarrei]